jgi:hypothetical protein
MMTTLPPAVVSVDPTSKDSEPADADWALPVATTTVPELPLFV